MLTAGLSAAVLAGAGVAAAEGEPPGGGAEGASQTTDTPDEKTGKNPDEKPAAGAGAIDPVPNPEPDDPKPADPKPPSGEPVPNPNEAGKADAGTVVAQQNTGTVDVSGNPDDAKVEVEPDSPKNDGTRGEEANPQPVVRKLPAAVQRAAAPSAAREAASPTPVSVEAEHLDGAPLELDELAVAMAPMRADEGVAPLRPPVDPEPTDVLGSVAAAVTEALGSLLDVLSPNGSPLSTQPHAWTAAAAARREIETAFAAPSLAPSAAEQATSLAPARPTLVNIVGALAWSVLDAVTKFIDIPPKMPAGSPVSFGRSTVEIDCGPDGYTADADWYYPSSGEPDKIIYFQHGFLARAVFYDVTLRELAERNNAIVVAPSITSNYFDCHGCSLTGEPMEAGVARLFEGDRTALVASARAAGYEGDLPEEFVFMGQSAGAILAAGASGFFYDNAPSEDLPDLVGVILYDVSASGGALEHALVSLPESVPVLHVAAPASVLNTGGNAAEVFAAVRPGQFNGVQLVNGSHSDGFQSSAYGGLVQAFVNLAFGASTPENVEAVQVLSQGWITDMYERRVYDPRTRTGYYGDPGAPGQVVIDIETDAGVANAYVLPGPPPALSPIERLIAGFLSSLNGNVFATCAANSATSVPTSGPILVAAGRESGCGRRAT